MHLISFWHNHFDIFVRDLPASASKAPWATVCYMGKIIQSTCWHFSQDPIPTFNFLQLPPNLHTLELRFYGFDQSQSADASRPGGLFDCVIPNLNTLILDEFTASDPTSSYKFWRAHPGIKRLELGHHMSGSWFNDFEVGMLPCLRYLEVIRSSSLKNFLSDCMAV